MIDEGYNQFKKCSEQRNSCSKNNTYSMFLEYFRKNGIKVANFSSNNNIQKEFYTHQHKKSCTEEAEDRRLIEDEGMHGRGLFQYSDWWEKNVVDIFVNGDMLTGIPIFTDKNTLRVVNDNYSYFIPLEKLDYIRTPDGLKSSNTQ